jgi:uncharacterized protein (DUF2062 family)
MTAVEVPLNGARRSFVRRRIVDPLFDQMQQGFTPAALAAALCAGAIVGVFPILGASTFLCLAIAAAARLNHPTVQLANYLVYPLQIPLIFAFVRLGETLLGRPHVPFSIAQLIRAFRADPLQFLRQFGASGLHGIFAWSITAIPAALVLYPLLRFALQRMWRRG